MRIVFHLSTNCNLRCTYCYQHDKASSVMPFEYAKRLLDDLFLYKVEQKGCIFSKTVMRPDILLEPIVLNFFGGECTLYLDLIQQIIQYFEELCDKYNQKEWKDTYEIWVETNGTTFLQPDVYEFYKKYKDRLDVPITIDGCKECHDKCRLTVNGEGSYDIVEEGVKAHFELFGHQPNSKLTFCKDNIHYMKEIVQNLVSLGYTYIRGSWDGTDVNMSSEQSLEYYQCLKEAIDYVIDNKINFWLWILGYAREEVLGPLHTASCGSDGSQIAINWDGDIYFCQQLSESFIGDKDKELRLGNINTGITNLEGLLSFYNNLGNNILDYECFNCPLANLCEPCPAVNLKIYNQTNHLALNCGAGIATARALIYFAKRAQETDYPYFQREVKLIQDYFKDGLPDRKYKIEILHPEE